MGTNFAMAAVFNLCADFEHILLVSVGPVSTKAEKTDHWLSSTFLEGYTGMPEREYTSSHFRQRQI
jgi:hypothetical protein